MNLLRIGFELSQKNGKGQELLLKINPPLGKEKGWTHQIGGGDKD